MITTPLSRSLLLKVVGVDLDVLLPFVGDFAFLENGIDRALWHTGGTIDAFVGVDVEHLAIRFVVSVRRMDTVDGADFYAGSIAGPDARLSDDIGHE